MATADQYINQVLEVMPVTMPARGQIAMELRAHIAERLAHGHALEDVIHQLGDPAKLADSYLSADPLVPAPHSARLGAKVVDVLAVVAVILPIAWLITRGLPEGFAVGALFGITAFCGSVLLGIYTGVAEFQLGQTLGKRLFGLRVVQESGRRISVGQAVVRQISLFFSYSIDLLFIPFTERRQRAFELLSKTRVVVATLLATLILGSTLLLAQSAADPSGHWQGAIQVPGMTVSLELDLVRNDNGTFIGTFSQPAQSIRGLPLSDVVVKDRSIRFAIKTTGGGRFEGTLDDSGTSISGSFATNGFALPLELTRTGDGRIDAMPASAPIASALEGDWTGTLETGGRQARFLLRMGESL